MRHLTVIAVSGAVSGVIAAGCQDTGALDLQLALPTVADLRPSGMQTITVIAQSPEMDPIASTAVIDKAGHFSAGDLPVGKNIQVDVLLRDVSSRLVGVGEAPQLVDLSGDKTATLSIPVRRPFVYASSGTQMYTYDSSLDSRDTKFQGALAGVSSPQLAVSVGGDRLVVASGTSLQIVDTATNMVVGQPIAIPGAIRDAAAVPGKRKVAVGHASGVSIVDIDGATVVNVGGPAVDRITVGPANDGKLTAYGLVGRVAPPADALEGCSGSSQIVTVPVDAPPASVTAMALAEATSDIAAAPNTPALYATEPCAGNGKVVRIDGELSTDVPLERAALLTIAGGRVWAAGTHAAQAVCPDGTLSPPPCAPSATYSCTIAGGSSGSVGWANPGAQLILLSIPLAGGAPIELDLPERRETMLDKDDMASEHAQVLHPISLEPVDLVALPGGQYVSVVTKSTYYTEELADQTGLIILPCLEATTGDWLLVDLASASISARVRTKCDLTYGPADVFKRWMCELPPPGEQNTGADYTPISVGALFGAR